MLPEPQLRNEARMSLKRSYSTHIANEEGKDGRIQFQQDRKNLLSIRKKLQSNNAITTKADKGAFTYYVMQIFRNYHPTTLPLHTVTKFQKPPTHLPQHNVTLKKSCKNDENPFFISLKLLIT